VVNKGASSRKHHRPYLPAGTQRQPEAHTPEDAAGTQRPPPGKDGSSEGEKPTGNTTSRNEPRGEGEGTEATGPALGPNAARPNHRGHRAGHSDAAEVGNIFIWLDSSSEFLHT